MSNHNEYDIYNSRVGFESAAATGPYGVLSSSNHYGDYGGGSSAINAHAAAAAFAGMDPGYGIITAWGSQGSRCCCCCCTCPASKQCRQQRQAVEAPAAAARAASAAATSSTSSSNSSAMLVQATQIFTCSVQ